MCGHTAKHTVTCAYQKLESCKQRVAVVKVATHKSTQKDSALLSEVSSEEPKVPQLGKVFLADSLCMCSEWKMIVQDWEIH